MYLNLQIAHVFITGGRTQLLSPPRAAARLAPSIECSTNGQQRKSKMSGAGSEVPLMTACPPHPPPPPPEMWQAVCGSCRHLLSYPRGAKHIQCSCCQTVNLVLEANQVGNVKCEGCHVLLMYPYGAPSVRCSSCSFVTEIGVNNQRPPLSVQQGQLPLPPHPPPNTVP